jgi:hypothetical protein
VHPDEGPAPFSNRAKGGGGLRKAQTAIEEKKRTFIFTFSKEDAI